MLESNSFWLQTHCKLLYGFIDGIMVEVFQHKKTICTELPV